jgi:hypothetical protein
VCIAFCDGQRSNGVNQTSSQHITSRSQMPAEGACNKTDPNVFLLQNEQAGRIVAFRSAEAAWIGRCFREAKGDKEACATETV